MIHRKRKGKLNFLKGADGEERGGGAYKRRQVTQTLCGSNIKIFPDLWKSSSRQEQGSNQQLRVFEAQVKQNLDV